MITCMRQEIQTFTVLRDFGPFKYTENLAVDGETHGGVREVGVYAGQMDDFEYLVKTVDPGVSFMKALLILGFTVD